tara:strand:- start:1384 stop:1710 length:327 start_codon:yes stop_codon:yes gene_type:complete
LKVTWEKEYDIVLLRGDGEEEYLLGRCDLKEGHKLLRKCDAQFVRWFCDSLEGNHDDKRLFDLPKPYNKTPVRHWEGGDLFAHAHDEEYIHNVDEDGWVLWNDQADPL